MWPTSRGKTRVTKPDYILSGDDEVRPWVSFASGWLSEWEQLSKTIGNSCELSYSKFAQQSWVRITRILAEYYANLVIFQRRASQMLEPKTGNRLRNKIWDDKTHKDVSYYADFFSNADYGTTHVAVLAPDGDAVSVTSTINMRWV